MTGIEAVRRELDAIREGLLVARFTHGGAFELRRRLEAAVEHFQSWAAEAQPAEIETLADVQRRLQALQPLFENAHRLQSGWFELAACGSGYDNDGKSIEAAESTPGLTLVA